MVMFAMRSVSVVRSTNLLIADGSWAVRFWHSPISAHIVMEKAVGLRLIGLSYFCSGTAKT